MGVQEEITEGAWLFLRPRRRCLLGRGFFLDGWIQRKQIGADEGVSASNLIVMCYWCVWLGTLGVNELCEQALLTCSRRGEKIRSCVNPETTSYCLFPEVSRLKWKAGLWLDLFTDV